MADVRSILDAKDYKYLRAEADPGFSPEKNRKVIVETMLETAKYFDMLSQKEDTEMMNRIDILSTYARYRFNVGTKNIKKYLGDKQYNAIVGEKILSKLRVAESVNRLAGNTKFKKGILL